jgi:hypothetical protein
VSWHLTDAPTCPALVTTGMFSSDSVVYEWLNHTKDREQRRFEDVPSTALLLELGEWH